MLAIPKPGTRREWLHKHISYNGPPCLTWPFGTHSSGYGGFGDKASGERESHYAHRYMCELVNGPPPSPEHEAAHSCGRGKFGCVDPRHLSWKTISENSLDCRAHGTQTRNRRGNRGHLTDDEADEIKALNGYLTQAEIARMFNTSPPTVRDIITGRSRANRTLRKPLTDAEAIEVRQSAERPSVLAKRFKTTPSTILRIQHGRSYKDIPNGQSTQTEKT